MQNVGQQTLYDLRKEIFERMQRLPMSFFDRTPVGRLVTRVTTDVDALNDLFAAGIAAMANDAIVLLCIGAVMMEMNWRLALATFAVLPLIVISTWIFRDRVRDANRRIRTAIARINSFLQEHISGMSVVQLFNRERKSKEQFAELNRIHMEAYKDAISGLCRVFPGRRIVQHGGDRHRFLVWRIALARRRGGRRRADHIHAVRAAILPPDSGPERKIQYPAIGHGGLRAHLQAAGRAVARAARGNSASAYFSARRNRIPQRVVCLPRRRKSQATKTGCCATFPSTSRRGRPSPSSATPAPGKPR